MGSWVDINTCTDAWTHSKQGMGTEMRWLGNIHCAIQGTHVSIKLCIGIWGDIGIHFNINTCTCAYTHSNQGVGWLQHTHTVPHRGTHFSMWLCIGGGEDMESQVDMKTCTDACTHSSQGVGLLQHTHSATQKNPCFHVSMLKWWSRYGESSRHKYMYQMWSDWYTHTVLHRGTHFLCNYAKGAKLKWEVRWTLIHGLFIYTF